MLASQLEENVDSDRFSAMCSSLLALSTRVTKEAEKGLLRQIILDGEGKAKCF